MKKPVTIVLSAVLTFLSAGIIAAEGLPIAKPSEVGMSAERFERMDSVMGKYIGDGALSGVVTLVARHGKVAHFEAHGWRDIGTRTPMTTDTIFRIASMTKAITSVAVMMLYEEGRFILDDPVSKYIPEFSDMKVLVLPPDSFIHSAAAGYALVPAKREMTIRQLHNHTSGLSSTLWKRPVLHDMYREELDALNELDKSQTRTIHDLVKALARLPLHHHPGEQFEYGFSTDVLGYLIEVVSGMTFDEFLGVRLFEPLGMTDTMFYVPDNKLDRLATLYSPDGNGGLVERSKGYRGSKTYFSGAGGLFSTASDYARFLQMLLNGGTLDGVRILSRPTVEMMTQNSIGDLTPTWPQLHGDKFGLGFGIRTTRGEYDENEPLGTYSWGGVFNTIYYVCPKEDMFCVFMNQLIPQDHLTVRRQFRVLSFQAIDD